MESQRHYLARLGLANSPKDAPELLAAKAAYRKWYKREKNKEYRKNRMYLKLMLLPYEKRKLQQAAKNHKQPLSTFIKSVSLAYLEKVYILPDETQLHKLEIAYRKVGNNINQIAKKCNSQTSTRYFDVVRLQNQVTTLEKETTKLLKKPMTLEKLIEKMLEQPQLLEKVKQHLQRKGYL